MSAPGFNLRRAVALAVFGGFYRCPTSGRIVTALQGDDKALCNCGMSNPLALAERTHQTGTHIVRFLQEASVDEWLAQEYPEETASATRGEE